MADNAQLREILSWRLVTELWRRSPDTFMLLEMHPGGGLYDCLSLMKRDHKTGTLLDVNRQGSVHVHATMSGSQGNDGPWGNWTDRMLESPMRFVDEVTAALGIQIPARLPTSTATTITYRFITEFLTHTIGRLDHWECRNGYLDTSGWGGGRRDAWFSQFPEVARHAGPERHCDLSFGPAYYYWFLLKEEKPMLCLNTDGVAFARSGQVCDLMTLYQEKRGIWRLITTVAADLLP